MSQTVIVSGLVKPAGLRVRMSGKQAMVLQHDGKIFEVDVAGSTISQAGAAPGPAAGFDVSDDGKTAYVAGSSWGLAAVGLYGGMTQRIARRLVNPQRVTRDPVSGDLLVAESSWPGRLLRVSLGPAHVTVIGRGLQNVRGLALEQATGRILAAETAGGGRLVEPAPAGPSNVIVSGLGKPMDLAWLDAAQQRLLVTDAGGKRVALVDLTQPAAPPVDIVTGIGSLWAAQPADSSHILVGAGDTLLLVDYAAVPADPVTLHVPAGELFPAAWTRVPVQINDPAVAFNDLEFHVLPAESAAMVSYSRDTSFDPAKPHIMLCAGWMTGTHELRVRQRSTGTWAGKTKFEVAENWTDPALGPSISTFGPVESGPSGGTWGGPDSGDFNVPQNVRVNPAIGTRNVGVVLVDTSSARYPAGAALTTIITNLRNEMANGVMSGGQLRSVSLYYNQASNNAFNVNLAGVAGPISLPNAWGSYFTLSDDDWTANEDLDATVIAQLTLQNTNATMAGNPPVLDLSAMDSLIYVCRSVINPPADDLFVWPRASLSTKTHIIGWQNTGPFPIPLFRGIARIFIPDDWAARDGGYRQFHETACHELGHNLGLQDQYNQDDFSADSTSRIADFNPNQSWELMAWERDLPLPSAAHRLMLGWINPSRVRLYNFGVFGAIDETITLHAASAGGPLPGRYAAAEVRIEDGKNYYFEYRPPTAGRLPDGLPPEPLSVLGTEAVFRDSLSSDRPNILRVKEDADGGVDRGAFAAGDDYREQDTTSPGFTNDFIVDVVSTTADSASVRFRYAADLKPDPAITPWSASSNWQSPDIEVTNGRSLADPAFRNVPWEGHANTVIARVTNRGSSPARGVKVQFFAKDFTFGGGAEVFLGEQTQDVPVGATVPFICPQSWTPAVLPFFVFGLQYTQHSCLVARMAPFLDPVSNIWEVTPENNEAQSNYTWTATTTSSPASREVTVINAENTLDEAAYVYFTINQPHPLFRTYLDHRWVYLQPGERRQILVMVESLLGDDRFAKVVREFKHGERRIMTTLRLSAVGDTRATCTGTVLGGASILAITGIGTNFQRFDAKGGRGEGLIVRTDTGTGVSGSVLVSITPRDPDDPRKEMLREIFAQGGHFVVELGDIKGMRVA
ncbi:MAG TPA: hypothetical protein VGF59_00125, partial [Bryobacteraceae bacterium]